MMRAHTVVRWSRLALLALLVALAPGARAQDSSGTEFVFAFQNNFQGAVALTLFITGEQDAQGTVTVPGIAFDQAFAVQAGAITAVEVPAAASQLALNGTADLGARVLSDAPVSVYALSRQPFTTDAFMLLPRDALGAEYVAMSYDGLAQFAQDNLTSEVAVVATEDGTLVQIVPAATAGANPAGEAFIVTLDALEVYQLNTNLADLTGTVINASAPVAVMGGHRCADVPALSRSPTGGRIGWCDHLIEMLPPVSTWGRSFLSVPLATRLNGSVLRVLAAENGTQVTIGSQTPVRLDRGEFVEQVVSDFVQIGADAPVQVAQYAPGQAFDNVNADPFMMLIPPNEQFLQRYTFATPDEGFASNFVNVTLPTLAAGSLLLDGAPVDAGLFTVIGASAFSGAQIPLAPGTHTLSAGQPFGIHVYGFNAYDSYGYPGGQAFAELNPTADSFAPSFGPLRQIGRTLLGAATDSEDLNANGVLDPGEDLNANGVLDRRTEDLDGNGQLDPGEDANANGLLDRDRSVLAVELLPGADNLAIEVLDFVAGLSPRVNYRLDLIDPALPGSGTVAVRDLAGNTTQRAVQLSNVPVLSDVQIVSTVAGAGVEVDQASFTRAPLSVDVQPGQTVIEWRFEAITAGEIEDLGFDVVLSDPVAGEQRLVTQRLQVSYTNAPFGERISTELGAQSVLVSATVFALAVTSAEPNYGPDTAAGFRAEVTNAGSAANGGTLEFAVEDAAGNPVTTLAPAAFGPLAAGAAAGFDRGFDTGTLIAGAYRLHVRLRDDQNRVVNEAFTPFSIVNSTAGLPLASVGILVGQENDGAFVARERYHTTDLVQMQARITNQSVNTLIDGAALGVQVLGPTGQTVFEQEIALNATLGPGALRDLRLGFMLADAAQGVYQVQATLIDTATLALIGSDTGAFTVARDLALSVAGTVGAAFDELLLGDTQVCTDTVTSRISEPLTGLPVITSLVNIAAQNEVGTATTAIDLAAGATRVTSRDETTGGVQGDFACVLRVDTGGDIHTLGFARFAVFDLIADPGPDQTALVGETVSLDGSASRETIDRPLTYRWRFAERPPGSQAALSDDTVVAPTFFVDEQGVYTLELIVNNGLEDSRAKRMRVTVPNRPALADAGPDQAVAVGETAQLDGSGSIDLDGDTLAFRWTVVQRPAASQALPSDPAAASPTLFIDVAGVYELELVVNDGFVDSAPDRVLLNVGNVPPVADAGVDLVALLGDVITLDGSGSTDVNGDNLGFRWFFEVLPPGSSAQLVNNGAVRPTFTIDAAGVYVVRLTVNDGLADSDPDLVAITVGNAAPVADAGADRAGTVGQRVVLDAGASSDPNGDALGYRWNLLARPPGSAAVLLDLFTPSPSFTIDVQGDYLLQLIVNDGQLDSAPDTLVVSGDDLRPIADAAFEQAGELFTGDVIVLDGAGSFDPEGVPLGYRWEFVERPDGSNAFLSGADTAAPSFTLDVQGAYVAQLIVSDGQRDSLPATVLIEALQSCLDNLAIRPKYNKIQLTWDYNPATEFVEVERALALNGPYEVIAQTDSTYATYLDQPVTPNTRYYYRIRGVFPAQQLTECRDVGEGLVCDGDFCPFVDENIVLCGGEVSCEVIEFLPERNVLVACDGGLGGGGIGDNSCPANDFFCQAVCGECNGDLSCIENAGIDPALCEAPASARQSCSTQVIATVPTYRVRMGTVPDLSGLNVEQAQARAAQASFTLGTIGFERTTAVASGLVIRQDVPRDSVMPLNSPIDIVVSTRGESP